jgi:hypothetical protein
MHGSRSGSGTSLRGGGQTSFVYVRTEVYSHQATVHRKGTDGISGFCASASGEPFAEARVSPRARSHPFSSLDSDAALHDHR